MAKFDKLRPEKIRAAHSEELVDHYWGSINYVFSLIKASELKAGLILSFYGILLNFIFQHVSVALDKDASLAFFLFSAGWFICTALSIYFSIRCFMPRIESRYDRNMFFFGDIVTKFGDIRQFSKTFYETSLDEEELFDQLGQQIYIISKIASYKFRNVNRSLSFLAIGLLLLLGAVVSFLLVNF
ncbi:MAG: Pycsar system effector family protein [Christiangramia sp.]|uniref:Pycsar effector protein domain-containing protein n=1 Tax=Christiangramia flava JLT2011 TaxID=1229726 RepID=A0A1L7I6M1_9FLAO|nr:Pycsar system effector family protein [Christiangramia flava]APU68765.1 hypothetical protein GRFL_2041 [Christiangramia flava JLT2011]OSS39090.1 hypothetical protein C723_2096 [Christiangramia flava JLT2011]